MIRRLPVLPTLVVSAAAAIMVVLGVWQLGRAREKNALIARYQAAQTLPPIAFPSLPMGDDALPLFRRATGLCLRPVSRRVTAGRNRAGDTGYAVIIDCSTGAEGPGIAVELGWSANPAVAVTWPGGTVSGIIAPDRKTRLRLVADAPPVPGLQASAPPSLEVIPNNHRFYAVQWFLFAAIALLIYGLAVRTRLAEPQP
ncbi:MAG: SURF1 family protein [Sphingomicrobium sp.]